MTISGSTRYLGGVLRELPRAPVDQTLALAPVVNPFLSWLNLSDSDGTKIDRYQLLAGGSWASLFRHPISQLWQAVADIAYALGSTFLVYAIAAVDVITNPEKLVTWMGSLYEAITSRIYMVIPPYLFIGLTFTVLLFSVFMLEPRLAKAGAPNDFALYRTRQQNWERLAAGFFIASLALALSKNPFRPLRAMLSSVSEIAGYATGDDAQTLGQTTMASAVNTILRPLTQMITYHDTLSPACSAQWSKRLNTGLGTLDCLTPEQNAAAAAPGVYTFLLAVMLLLVAASYTYLAYIVYRSVASHIAWIAGYMVGLVYVAGISLLQRRPYDPLIKSLSNAAAHAAMVLLVIVTSVILPAWTIQLVHGLTWMPLWLQFICIAGGIYASSYAVKSVADKETLTKISSLFQTKLGKTKIFSSWMYPEYVTSGNKWLLTSAIGDRIGADTLKQLSEMKRSDLTEIKDAFKSALKEARGVSSSASTSAESTAIATATGEVTVVQADPDTEALLAALTEPSIDSGADPAPAIAGGASASSTGSSSTAQSPMVIANWFNDRVSVTRNSQWIRSAPTLESPTAAIAAVGTDGETVSVVPPVDPMVDAQGRRIFVGRDDGSPYLLESHNGVPYVVRIDEDQFSTLRKLADMKTLPGGTSDIVESGSGQHLGQRSSSPLGQVALPALPAADVAAVNDPGIESGGANVGAVAVHRQGSLHSSVGSWVRPKYQDLTSAATPREAALPVIDAEEVYFTPEHPIEMSRSEMTYDHARKISLAEFGGSGVDYDPAEANGVIYATVGSDGQVAIAVPGQGGVGESTWA